jgi:hypothetical protein
MKVYELEIACSMHGGMRNVHKIFAVKVKVREHLGDLGRNGRIMPKGTY